MVPALVGGNTAQPEEAMTMTGMIEEIIAPGIDLTQDQGTRGKTHQMEAEDTLDTTGEGDAKGPWVMKGPS